MGSLPDQATSVVAVRKEVKQVADTRAPLHTM